MSEKNIYAHSANSYGQWHDLVQHLKKAAQLAEGFAEKIHCKDLGYWAGFWHDLGKFHQDFQAYLRNPEGKRGTIQQSFPSIE